MNYFDILMVLKYVFLMFYLLFSNILNISEFILYGIFFHIRNFIFRTTLYRFRQLHIIFLNKIQYFHNFRFLHHSYARHISIFEMCYFKFSHTAVFTYQHSFFFFTCNFILCTRFMKHTFTEKYRL